jgi:hypothetical protein
MPSGSAKRELREATKDKEAYTRDDFMRDLRKVAKRSESPVPKPSQSGSGKR